MAYVSSTTRTDSALLGTVKAYFDAALEAFAKYRLYNRTVSELSALSGMELADLGLSHGTIRSAAREAVYGK
ncbi:MAG: DUF1127 domain-containing protein [Pseudomonadota bacterium]